MKKFQRLPKLPRFWDGKKIRKQEKKILAILLSLFLVSALALLTNIWSQKTKFVAQPGGTYREGLIGELHYLNPALAQLNEPDRQITPLIYPGLLKHDAQGKLVPNLAKSFKVLDNGKTFEFILKKDLKWQDGKPLTIDDVVFTVELVQNPDYQSPIFLNWQGVKIETEKPDKIRFVLTDPYSLFLENTTLGIMPQHIWGEISKENFALNKHNLKPIGAGPYKVLGFQKTSDGSVKSLILGENPLYFGEKPYFKRVIFRFYSDEASAARAYWSGQIDAWAPLSANSLKNLESLKGLKLYKIRLPRYFAVFFNDKKNPALRKYDVRQALVLATDRQKIIDEVLNGQAELVDGPLPLGAFYVDKELPHLPYNPEEAQALLKEALKEPLELELTTLELPQLQKVAEKLKEMWEKVGVKVSIKIYPETTLKQEIIKDREYEALLFGQSLRKDPDPFSFWHSSQRKHPGLNLTSYKNDRVDQLLEQARQTFDQEKKAKLLTEFQEIVHKYTPALFLYSPYFLFGAHQKIKGIKLESLSLSEQRLLELPHWYIKQRRVWK